MDLERPIFIFKNLADHILKFSVAGLPASEKSFSHVISEYFYCELLVIQKP